MGVVRKSMSCAVMIGCVVMTPVGFEVAALGVKKPGGPNPEAPPPPICCEVAGGSMSAKGMAVCGPEIWRRGAASLALAATATLTVRRTGAVKLIVVPTGSVIMTC